MTYQPNAMMPNAMESPRGIMGQTPPDVQPRTLREVLEEAVALTAVDRLLTPDEMGAWSMAIGHLQRLQMAQEQMGGAPGAVGQMAQQNIAQSGMMGQPPSNTMDYGAPGAVSKGGPL